MRVAIVGSRDYERIDYVKRFVRQLVPGTIVISGGARGVDRCAENYWRYLGGECLIIPADWEKLGARAGYVRNIEIVRNAEMIVAFWDGRSKGTKHTIELANKALKPLRIYMPSGEPIDYYADEHYVFGQVVNPVPSN